MTESQRAEFDRRVAALERRSSSGVGVSTAFGGSEVRATQVGFPAELTAAWSATDGYAWKQLVLSGLALVDPDVQRTGTGAVSADGSEDLASGTRGWLEIDPQAGGWIFVAGGGGSGGGGAAPGWAAGLKVTDCLRVTVVRASGDCSGIDAAQDIGLTWSAGGSRWESGATAFTGTGSGGTGQVAFAATTPVPTATIDGVGGMYLGGDGANGLLFAFGGAVLCGGRAAACANYFVVRFTCSCCARAGWGGGNKWYCVRDAGAEGACSPVFLLESDRCDDGLTEICAGPYTSESLAVAACGPGTTCSSGQPGWAYPCLGASGWGAGSITPTPGGPYCPDPVAPPYPCAADNAGATAIYCCATDSWRYGPPP